MARRQSGNKRSCSLPSSPEASASASLAAASERLYKLAAHLPIVGMYGDSHLPGLRARGSQHMHNPFYIVTILHHAQMMLKTVDQFDALEDPIAARIYVQLVVRPECDCRIRRRRSAALVCNGRIGT